MTDTTNETITVDQSGSVQTQGEVQTPSSDQVADTQTDADAQAPNPETDAPKQEPKKQEPKKPHGMQKRIDKLTYDARSAQREAEAMRLQNQQLQAQLAQAQLGRQQQPYPNQGQWQEPQEPWDEAAAMTQLTKDVRAAIEQEQAQNALVDRASTFIDSVSDPDVQDFLMSPNSGLTQEMGEVILELPPERGQALAAHLANNPQVVDQFLRMPVHMQAFQLATFEANASAQAAAAPQGQPAPKVSSAPSPAPTVSGASAAPKDPGKMTPDEYVIHRRKQKAQA